MFYLVEIFRTSSPGGSISSNPERTAPRRRGDEPGYIKVLQQRAGSLNIKRLLLIKENQISQFMGLMTPWTVASQVPLSMDFSRQEYWNRLPFPSPEDHLDPGIEPRSPTLQADCLLFESPGKP